MSLLFLLFYRNVIGAEKNIKIEVVPKVTISNEYRQQTFRVRVTVPRHKDNRLWSYSASCGSEIKSSEHELDKNSQITTTWYEDFTVLEDCIFQACLHREVLGKIQNYCDIQGVTVDALEPP